MPRKRVCMDWVELELDQFKRFLAKKIEEKGDSSFISTHEIDGALDEEFREWKDEVRGTDEKKKVHELSDIMTAAFWGIVSIRQAGTEW